MELCRGARDKGELHKISSRLKGYSVLNITQEVSVKAAEFVEKFHISHGLQIPDALIGASAIVHGLPLLTNNKKDFRYLPGMHFW